MLLRICLVFILAFAGQAPADRVNELLAADRGFATAAAGKDAVSAITAMLADDVILPGPGPVFSEGRARATEALRANPDNLTSKLEWAPIRGGVSADGQHGFTFGYMTATKADGTKVPMKYLAYWVRRAEGWRVAAYRRRPRPEGQVSLDMMPPSVPRAAVAPVSDAKVIEGHAASVAAAEKAFSDEAQKIGIGAAFTKFGHEDAVNMGGPKDAGFVVGSVAIGKSVGAGSPADSSPVSWAADHKSLAASSGDLGITFGYIRSNGKSEQPPFPFFTIWRRASPADPWRYIAE